MARAKKKEKHRAYSLRVSLTDSPEIWRVIQVRGDQTLEDLHDAICDAFDWDADHLWAFFMNNHFWDPKEEYGPPEVGEGAGDATETVLDSLKLEHGQEFCYIFDFGDEWRHTIEVADIESADDATYPRISESHGDAPQQYPDMEGEEEEEEEEESDDGELVFDDEYGDDYPDLDDSDRPF